MDILTPLALAATVVDDLGPTQWAGLAVLAVALATVSFLMVRKVRSLYGRRHERLHAPQSLQDRGEYEGLGVAEETTTAANPFEAAAAGWDDQPWDRSSADSQEHQDAALPQTPEQPADVTSSDEADLIGQRHPDAALDPATEPPMDDQTEQDRKGRSGKLFSRLRRQKGADDAPAEEQGENLWPSAPVNLDHPAPGHGPVDPMLQAAPEGWDNTEAAAAEEPEDAAPWPSPQALPSTADADVNDVAADETSEQPSEQPVSVVEDDLVWEFDPVGDPDDLGPQPFTARPVNRSEPAPASDVVDPALDSDDLEGAEAVVAVEADASDAQTDEQIVAADETDETDETDEPVGVGNDVDHDGDDDIDDALVAHALLARHGDNAELGDLAPSQPDADFADLDLDDDADTGFAGPDLDLGDDVPEEAEGDLGSWEQILDDNVSDDPAALHETDPTADTTFGAAEQTSDTSSDVDDLFEGFDTDLGADLGTGLPADEADDLFAGVLDDEDAPVSAAEPADDDIDSWADQLVSDMQAGTEPTDDITPTDDGLVAPSETYGADAAGQDDVFDGLLDEADETPVAADSADDTGDPAGEAESDGTTDDGADWFGLGMVDEPAPVPPTGTDDPSQGWPAASTAPNVAADAEEDVDVAELRAAVGSVQDRLRALRQQIDEPDEPVTEETPETDDDVAEDEPEVFFGSADDLEPVDIPDFDLGKLHDDDSDVSDDDWLAQMVAEDASVTLDAPNDDEQLPPPVAPGQYGPDMSAFSVWSPSADDIDEQSDEADDTPEESWDVGFVGPGYDDEALDAAAAELVAGSDLDAWQDARAGEPEPTNWTIEGGYTKAEETGVPVDHRAFGLPEPLPRRL